MDECKNLEDILQYNDPYNKKNLEELIAKIKANKVIPYIGAGMSILDKGVYPSWGAFLEQTSNEYLAEDDNDLKEYRRITDCEEKASFLYNNIGSLDFAKLLEKAFSPQKAIAIQQNLSNFPIYYIPTIFKNSLILTTNYDQVIELTFVQQNIPYSVSHPGHSEILNRSLRDDNLLIFKLHGDINEPDSSVIITKEQYDKVYFKDSQLCKDLQQIAQQKYLLFLGCSLESDRPVDLVAKISDAGINHFAIISSKKEILQERRLELAEKSKISSIIYPEDQHHCLKMLLEHIAEQVNTTLPLVDNSKELFSEQWFKEQCEKQIANLGDRYTPEMHVELSITNIFNALSRDSKFYERVEAKTDTLLKAINKANILKAKSFTDELSSLALEEVKSPIQAFQDTKIIICINEIYKIYEDELNLEIKRKTREQLDTSSEVYFLRHALSEIRSYREFINSTEIQAYNNPFILLTGEGGMGKSHLLADIVSSRMNEGKLSLLLLGQQFKDELDPIIEIKKILEVSNTTNILEHLNNSAKNNNTRLLIVIDALNEGNGKNIWNKYLQGLIAQIKKFPYLAFIASIRTENKNQLFHNNSKLESEMVIVNHFGFSEASYTAVKVYFDAYKLDYTTLPILSQEFSSPLFLRLFCRSFQNRTINFENISLFKIYNQYLNTINIEISERFKISVQCHIVNEAIKALVAYKFSSNHYNNFIPVKDAFDVLFGIEDKYRISHTLLDELINVGLITLETYRSDEGYVHVTYEKLDDFLYAKQLFRELQLSGIEEFKNKHTKLIYYSNLLESFSIVLSENNSYEIFEIFPDHNDTPYFIDVFCRALKWRASSSITYKAKLYLNSVILINRNNFKIFYETLLFLANKEDHCLNAIKTTELFLTQNLPDRDAAFIPIFNAYYSETETSIISILFDWCFAIKENNLSVSNEQLKLTAFILATFLITPNNKLRDESTRALINILSGKIDILILLLNHYKNMDDPYVIERLYAVAFGCIVEENNAQQIEKLALYTYNEIFNAKYAYPNILVRDYAKNIIDYAKHKIENEDILKLDVSAPYNSVFPTIPTDKEIESYQYTDNDCDENKLLYQQNRILSSMVVEYPRSGGISMYGDFGRYTFESYFYDFLNANEDLDICDLHNIAVKRIFDLGYSPLKHGEYDSRISYGRARDSNSERIGKKYQWIALYELAAQVSDKYNIDFHVDEHGNTDRRYCLGAFEPDIRTIDPTLSPFFANGINKNILKTTYTMPNISHSDWLSNIEDLPKANKLLQIMIDNKNYILLNGNYNWKEKQQLGYDRYEIPHKDLWIHPMCYIAKANSYDRFISYLSGKDFWGRWLTGHTELYHIYNKEYYWSSASKFYTQPYYGREEWTKITSEKGNTHPSQPEDKVLISTIEYRTERNGDRALDERGTSFYKPCNDIFKTLKLNYGRENSILYDNNGEVVCFDSREYLGENIGFFIEENAINTYLEQKNYKMFWCIMGEKIVYTSNNTFPQIHISGLIERDSNGNFIGELTIHDELDA